MTIRLAVLLGSSLLSYAQVAITVDATANRKPINPNIYGVAHATAQQLADLNSPLNRNGGNNTSRYNWQLNADNRGQDWYFQSIAEASATAGDRGDAFVALSKQAGAQAMLTIPMIEWVAKLGANRAKLASYSIAKYGAQTGADWQWFPDAGNGVLSSNGQLITWNDKNDANTPNSVGLQQGWAQHLVSRWGTAAAGGLGYYILDNEHSIWHSTHRDVRPTGARMEEVRNLMLSYAAMIRAVDPSAKIIGPEEWGWSGYTLSGYDQQYGSTYGWSNLPDRVAHGNMDYLPWLLDQFRLDGRRLLDIFSVHYYPQGGEFSNDTSAAMQSRRNRSTRSLWDPAYTDETWIADKVQLIPRLRNWVNTYYGATPIAITEYNWGAENHINGATAQADIYGIFGREGLDMGARWTTPDAATPTYKAMKMYRNYDGAKAGFGNISVKATVPNPDTLSAFAAERSSDGALTVMVINKVTTANTVNASLAGFPAGANAQVWQLTSANAIARKTDVVVAGGAFSTSVPAQSVTLFVIPRGQTGNQAPVASFSATPTSGTAPLAVVFNGSASSDADGTIGSYSWNFGDGASTTGVSASHTYVTGGTFTATLTVTDNAGATNAKSVSIVVNAAASIVAPSNLVANGGRRSVTLQWRDNSGNETGFYVEAKLQNAATFTRIGQVGANARTFTGSLSRGNYNFRVQAFGTGGVVSGYSNTASASVK